MTAVLLRAVRMFGNLRTWAYGHWIRSVIVAGVILSLIALTMAGAKLAKRFLCIL
ncbi:MAG: hypothetical protein ACRD6I_19120 [Candidatus Acidiferrales bacterium]